MSFFAKNHDEFQLRSFMSVDNRPLFGIEKEYLETGYNVNCIVVFDDGKHFKNDRKIVKSFRRVVKTSPILQTRVEGDGGIYHFSLLEKKEDWPLVRIQNVSNDDEVVKVARKIRDEEERCMIEGGNDARRSSTRMWIVRGPRQVAFSIVCPHHFTDGISLAVLLLKFYIYCRLPKFLWFLADRRSPDEVPTLTEMALKQDLRRLQGVDLDHVRLQGPWHQPDTFQFEYYDHFQPDAMSKLVSMIKEISHVSGPAMKRCRAQLRKKGVTITGAFQALALKTMALILEYENMNPDRKNLIAVTGVDCRNLGDWGVKSRDKRSKFPVIGNFAIGLSTVISADMALDLSIEDIALICNDSVDQIRTNTENRIRALGQNMAMDARYAAGVSSIILPDTRLRPSNVQLETTVNFGPMPHVWFFVVSWGKGTAITADMALPVAGSLTPDKLVDFIRTASKGSPLHSILWDLPL